MFVCERNSACMLREIGMRMNVVGLLRWHACMLREIGSENSYLDIKDYLYGICSFFCRFPEV